MKSERLKKLESELEDLEQWKKIGLVPKKDLKKHEEEIKLIKEKIHEEKERLKILKESGEMEEFAAPKRSVKPYAEPQTMPDLTIGADNNATDIGFDVDEAFETETALEENGAEEENTVLEEDEEDPFSDKNRWKRGVLEDPDADNW